MSTVPVARLAVRVVIDDGFVVVGEVVGEEVTVGMGEVPFVTTTTVVLILMLEVLVVEDPV